METSICLKAIIESSHFLDTDKYSFTTRVLPVTILTCTSAPYCLLGVTQHNLPVTMTNVPQPGAGGHATEQQHPHHQQHLLG